MRPIEQALRKAKSLEGRAKAQPLKYFRPTPPQKAFLSDPAKIKLMVGGNQTGKTSGGAVPELVWSSLGIHPYIKTSRPPINSVLVTHSHQQSIVIQEKLWEAIPKSELHPSVEFRDGHGVVGQNPVIVFRNGSKIYIRTGKQGIGLASMTLALGVIDEPIKKSAYGEVRARVLRGGTGGKMGRIAITMTPVGEDVSYIEDLIEQGVISHHVAPLSVEATTPEGLYPIISEEQVEQARMSYLPIDREARMSGSFNVGIPDGITFDVFEESMVSSLPPPPIYPYKYAIGIDHGHKVGTQVATLVAINMMNPDEPIIYVLDQYVAGSASPEAHARALYQMCERRRIPLNQIKWTGDAPHRGDQKGRGKMSNSALMTGFRKVLNVQKLPFVIRTISKPQYSVYNGAHMLQMTMARKKFFIHPRCKKMIEALKRWVLKGNSSARSKDKYGHHIDSLRYATVPTCGYSRVNIPFRKIQMY